MNSGYFYILAAHAMWGFFPLYWRLIHDVPAISLACHRIVWSFLLMMLVLPFLRGLAKNRPSIWTRETLMTYSLSAVLIAINWFSFLYAIETKHVLEASLGYYICPLLNVLLGIVILRERLTRPQTLAITIAVIGVVIMTVGAGRFPIVSLTMAASFAFYSLVKKKAKLDPLTGMWLETGILTAPAILWIFVANGGVQSNSGDGSLTTWALLIGGGLITTIPLVLFSAGAQRIPLTTTGILQYIGPTLQLGCATLIFHESLSGYKLLGYVFVWAAVLIYIFTLISRSSPLEARAEHLSVANSSN